MIRVLSLLAASARVRLCAGIGRHHDVRPERGHEQKDVGEDVEAAAHERGGRLLAKSERGMFARASTLAIGTTQSHFDVRKLAVARGTSTSVHIVWIRKR